MMHSCLFFKFDCLSPFLNSYPLGSHHLLFHLRHKNTK
uniref:Uncharacterized protein n=1 Tax=Anguilla anguilla TaxID=7936 RepID=A0A0E9S130_ANGAN